MRRTIVIAWAVVLFCGHAVAEDTIEYSTAGEWDIIVDRTVGDGCFVTAGYETGSVFRLGLNRDNDTVYVIWSNPDWKSIEYGKSYDLAIEFGNESPWSGTATGFSFDPPNNQPFLHLELDVGSEATANFVLEFMQEQFVKVDYEGKEILHLSLKDSFQAGLQLFECQKSADMWSRDPFQDTPATNDDPFE